MEEQKQVWNNIAEDWNEFKDNPIKRVLDFLSSQKGKILDLGSGAGRHLTNIKDGKMYLIDFSEKMIEFAKKKADEKKIDAEFYVSDVVNLPFKNNFFDGAILVSALHCIKGDKNRDKAIKELHRVLKPKSRVIVTVFNKNSKQFKNAGKEKYIKWLDKEKRYYYLFDEDEIHALFKKNKFKIIKRGVPKRSIEFIAEKI